MNKELKLSNGTTIKLPTIPNFIIIKSVEGIKLTSVLSPEISTSVSGFSKKLLQEIAEAWTEELLAKSTT